MLMMHDIYPLITNKTSYTLGQTVTYNLLFKKFNKALMQKLCQHIE